MYMRSHKHKGLFYKIAWYCFLSPLLNLNLLWTYRQMKPSLSILNLILLCTVLREKNDSFTAVRRLEFAARLVDALAYVYRRFFLIFSSDDCLWGRCHVCPFSSFIIVSLYWKFFFLMFLLFLFISIQMLMVSCCAELCRALRCKWINSWRTRMRSCFLSLQLTPT